MKIKTKTTTEVKLIFDLEELKILYDKLTLYCNFNSSQWEEVDPKTSEKYISKSPTDEVEEFLISLYELILRGK